MLISVGIYAQYSMEIFMLSIGRKVTLITPPDDGA